MAGYVIKRNGTQVVEKKRIDHAKAEFGKLRDQLSDGDVLVLVGDGRVLDHAKGKKSDVIPDNETDAKAEAAAERIELQQQEDELTDEQPEAKNETKEDSEGEPAGEIEPAGEQEDEVTTATKKEPKAKAPKAPKPPKEKKEPKARDIGDAVAVALRGLEVKQMAAIAEAMLDDVELTEGKLKKAKESIKQAKHRAAGTGGYDRANPGSARMSLGLIIRTFNKQLNLSSAKLRALAGE